MKCYSDYGFWGLLMKKYITVIFFSFYALSLASAPICSINQELNKDTASKLTDFRDQTSSTCLTCSSNVCQLKTWPEEKKGDEAVCKLLFCTPSYVSKYFEKPDNVKSGKTKIKFSYTINSKGKIKEIQVSSAKGAMNVRESYKYLQSFTSKTKFEPLSVDGKKIGIEQIQCEHIALTGKYEDVDKTMPVNQGIWRN